MGTEELSLVLERVQRLEEHVGFLERGAEEAVEAAEALHRAIGALTRRVQELERLAAAAQHPPEETED